MCQNCQCRKSLEFWCFWNIFAFPAWHLTRLIPITRGSKIQFLPYKWCPVKEWLNMNQFLRHHDNWILIGWWSNDVIKDINSLIVQFQLWEGAELSLDRHLLTYLSEKVEKDVSSLRHLTCDGLSTIILLVLCVGNSFGIFQAQVEVLTFRVYLMMSLFQRPIRFMYDFCIIFHDANDHSKNRTPFDVKNVYWTL